MATTRVYVSRAMLKWLREYFENKFPVRPTDKQIIEISLQQLKASLTGEEQRYEDEEEE